MENVKKKKIGNKGGEGQNECVLGKQEKQKEGLKRKRVPGRKE
jgi:hypothetical protein